MTRGRWLARMTPRMSSGSVHPTSHHPSRRGTRVRRSRPSFVRSHRSLPSCTAVHNVQRHPACRLASGPAAAASRTGGASVAVAARPGRRPTTTTGANQPGASRAIPRRPEPRKMPSTRARLACGANRRRRRRPPRMGRSKRTRAPQRVAPRTTPEGVATCPRDDAGKGGPCMVERGKLKGKLLYSYHTLDYCT